MSCLDKLKHAPAPAIDGGSRKLAAERPPLIQPSWSVPFWYINPSSGSDENTGTDAGHSIKHYYELVGRWGTNRPIIQSSVVITLMADQPDNTDCIDLRPIMVNDAGLLNFVGSLTQVSTGSMSGVVVNNRGSSPFWQANLGSAATGAIGLLLLDSTQSAVMWVGNVSGSVATFTQPFGASITTPPAWWNGGGVGTPAELTLSNGDAFTTQRLPKACVIAFAPTTQASWPAAAGDGILAMMGRIWVPDTSGTSSHTMLTNPTARITESRIDTELQYETLVNNGVGEIIFNSYLAGSGTLSFSVFGGLIGTPANPFELFCRGCALDGDVQVYGNITTFPAVGGSTAIANIGRAYLTGTNQIVGPVELVSLQYGGPSLYGTYTLNLSVGGTLYYQGSAVSAFGGTPTLQFAGTSFGDAVDETLDLAPRRPHRALTPANLDATIASGGFGSIAYGPGESVIASLSALGGSPTPSAYLNAGGGILFTPNSPGPGQLTISSTVVGGVSSVTGAGTVNCSPTTGAVTCTGSGGGGGGVTSVTGSNGVTCTPTTGAATCKLSTPNIGACTNPSVMTVASGSLSCTTLYPVSQMQFGGANNILVTDNGPGTAEWAQVTGDLSNTVTTVGGSPKASLSLINLQGHALNANANGGAPSSGDYLQFRNSEWENVPHPSADGIQSCNLNTSSTNCTSITLSVLSGQVARLWLTAAVASTDNIPHTVVMLVNGVAIGDFPVSGNNVTLPRFNTGAAMYTDSTAGTNTYTFQSFLNEAINVGAVTCNRCNIRGMVTGP